MSRHPITEVYIISFDGHDDGDGPDGPDDDDGGGHDYDGDGHDDNSGATGPVHTPRQLLEI